MQLFNLAAVGAAAFTLAAAMPAPFNIGLLNLEQLANHQIAGCDLSEATLPTSGTVSKTTGQALTAPDSDLVLTRVLLGKGTQNYTCADSTNDTLPAAVGAKANLYDASCLAAYAPSILNELPKYLMQLSDADEAKIAAKLQQLAGKNMCVGHHLFEPDASTPVFDFRLQVDENDIMVGKKAENVPAPAGAAKGTYGVVDWLQLTAQNGTVGGYKLAYRVETAGGAQSPTCLGQEATFQMPYAAQYWFYDDPNYTDDS